jgi:hypothetical protein
MYSGLKLLNRLPDYTWFTKGTRGGGVDTTPRQQSNHYVFTRVIPSHIDRFVTANNKHQQNNIYLLYLVYVSLQLINDVRYAKIIIFWGVMLIIGW